MICTFIFFIYLCMIPNQDCFAQKSISDTLRTSQNFIQRFIDSMRSEEMDVQRIIATEKLDISIESAKIEINIFQPLPSDNPQEARNGLQRILIYNAWAKQEYEKIVEITSKIKNLNDNDIRILTMSHVRLGNWQKAYKIGKNIAAKDKETLLALGLVSLFSKKNSHAITFYKRALNESPTDPEIHARIGELFYIQNDYSKAILYWEKALEYNNNRKDQKDDLDHLKYFLGIAHYKANNLKASNRYFTMVKPNEDCYKYAIFFRALYEERQGNFKRAKELLHKPALLNSGFEDIEYYIYKERGYVSFVLGNNALSQNDRNNALEEFREAAREFCTIQTNFEEHKLLMILRSIFLRCIEVLDPKDKQNHIIASQYFKQLYGLTRSAHDGKQIDSKYVLSMAHLFFLMDRHDLSADCYAIVVNEFPIARYNLIALRPETLMEMKIDLPKSCREADFVYLFYNFVKALYINNQYNKTLELSVELESCLNRHSSLKYNLRLQIANLSLRSRALEQIYYNDPAKGARKMQLLKDKIARLTEKKYSPAKLLPPFIEFGSKKELLVLIK